ncbi:TetR/AcrR family transcriptional regulator [Shouchella clausii]|jgi:AcrR family transcriptional regulator|uniref:TetR/AcrR family transcriptional regulator n=1 Tax=Shouchella clausii TaxID=79880 RepID=UPI0007979F15|nr:TetR/AcrR family transcriptional regulator [Shouchella clausii]PAD40766.1 TetR/AcrR family transcriptional regulator [Bacillus sp. 7520-S]KKI86773.1 transcriptional regulator [Shouchella clausii]MBU8598767.1 TetR/AcrR family transcriptional regulator [Shouchella clausii]MCY1106811.1 TetR/AcrR family transcriptional regulator [Shouchella clausii]MEB5480697.1 TetR/AcrR family transcriptional regulator [Shouchella clausii]
MKDIKAEILNCGKAIFQSKGYKDTNISDITKMAGTGVGTFYNYYSSKEQLFLEVYMSENKQIKNLIVESLDVNEDPITLVKEFVTQSLEVMHTNRILKEWYNRDVFRKLEKHFRENPSIDDDSIRNFFVGLLKKWKAEGKIRSDLDDGLLAAIFDSLAYIDSHKEDIGIQHFPEIIQHLVEFIMKGLTNCRK